MRYAKFACAIPLIVASLVVANVVEAKDLPITVAGERLAKGLDGLEVESYWLPGRPVHWKTGEVDPQGRQAATHCSTFAAAACDRFYIYLLRPPEHSATFLANAQNSWLKREGRRQGWKKVATSLEAQQLANEGVVVLASYANPNAKNPGPIAVIRPAIKSEAEITREGPQITQAGAINARSASLRRGFSKHPGAFENHEIEFFAYELPK